MDAQKTRLTSINHAVILKQKLSVDDQRLYNELKTVFPVEKNQTMYVIDSLVIFFNFLFHFFHNYPSFIPSFFFS